MSRRFSYAAKADGGYQVLFEGTVIDNASTVKEARNKIAKIKRDAKHSNLVNKFFSYSKDFKQK
ncbi:hypothetical protein GAP32_029 [Cronobacter phage vB_CsaM_GAP32]|uniref:Uncharacterized protein n=1 Tax=Cronobacter phage vB_CsaM_GAP32 TaxID=1141136 RepID=K4F748_9CAUD|nr:hypothetical protein GAP32_029 [Cronobacter phage vB_CsaM_GAP32]AFC21477.1 hypothetical protein GAP32_029 [Cronobacter phage vB_CsaM_GAP32]